VYAFEPYSGRKLWEPFITEGQCKEPIQVSDSTIFQYATNDRLYAINITNGKKRWDMFDGRKVLAVMDGEAFVLDKSNKMLIVDEITGKTKTVVPMTGFDLFLANATAQAIYTATRDGRLFCIRKLKAGHLNPEMLRQRR